MFNQLVRSTLKNENIHLGIGTTPKNKLASELHYHDEIEILHVDSGLFYILVNGKEYEITGGTTVMLSPRIPHSTYTKDVCCSTKLIQFRLENYLGDNMNVGKYFNRFIQNADSGFSLFKSPALSRVIDEIFEEYTKRDTEYELVIKGEIFKVIATLIREGVLPESNQKYSEPIAKLLPSISYIENHYAEKITLDEIASVQRLAPSYFCRLFKRASGTGFVDYLNFVRICKSERMLSDTKKSILEISYELGFSSVSYFNRLFKKYKNCTPTQYRAAQKVNA